MAVHWHPEPKWARAASLHHSGSRAIIRRCTPDRIKERMAASSRHTVRVQKARSASQRTETARLPAAALAWRAARKDWIRNAGKYRQDRTRRRVMGRDASRQKVVRFQ